MPPDPRETEQQQATHTPTPWKIEVFSEDPTYTVVSSNTGRHVTDFVKPADGRRIVACVNALAGWDIATIEFVAGIENPLAPVAALTTVADLMGEKALALLAETEGDANDYVGKGRSGTRTSSWRPTSSSPDGQETTMSTETRQDATHTQGVMDVGELTSETDAEWVSLHIGDKVIADVTSLDVGGIECNANAARLAACWNAHDDLVKTCENVVDDIREHFSDAELATTETLIGRWRDQLSAALAKATPRPA